MKHDLRNNKDFLSGLMFIAIGVVGIWMALDYPFGSALRMGPGYFPTVLSGIMIAFGLYVMANGLRSKVLVQGNWSVRALIVLPVSMVTFGVLMELTGFIPALVALVIVAAAAGKEFKFVEVLPLTIGLTVVCTAGFIYGLGLPYPLIKGLWEY